MQPKPGMTIMDPAAGTGGFLLIAHEYISKHYAAEMDAEEKRFLKVDALRGVEIVDAAERLCAMNLFLHGSAVMRVRFVSRIASLRKIRTTTIWCSPIRRSERNRV